MKSLSPRHTIVRACAIAAAAFALAGVASSANAAVSAGSMDPCLDTNPAAQLLCGDAVSAGSMTGPDLGGSITQP